MLESIIPISILTIFTLLFLRTTLWHLQNWQIREYRWDRMIAYFKTKQGTKNLFNLWFFKGILPRPKFSKRILVIIITFIVIHIPITILIFRIILDTTCPITIPSSIEICPIPKISIPIFILITSERLIWLSLLISTLLSKIPRYFAEKRLFAQAKKIISQSKNVTVIGITGSYGKSSTKEILHHLLEQNFGSESVLKNPANENNEIAIARLILANKEFFISPSSRGTKGEQITPPSMRGAGGEKKFFIAEIGAYRRGEIAKVCKFIQPHLGIITGLNSQHIELFGSQSNIQRAKFELAESVSDKVFFAADNELLSEIFADRAIKATKIGISTKAATNIKSSADKTEFTAFGENFTLPWPGEFFVSNALLCLELFRELDGKTTDAAKYLGTLPPLQRALKITDFKNGKLLTDLYSSNPDGVLNAIKHLGQFKGKKIFVSNPLLELGDKSQQTHEQIFSSLSEIKAEVFWMKDDFSDLGKQICKNKFHGKDLTKLKKLTENLETNDAILLESKLPQEVLNLFT